MAVQLMLNPSRALDGNAWPAGAATAEFFETLTTTPLTVYSTAALSVALGTSITADGDGVFAQAFVSGTTDVKVVIKDRDGNVLQTIDPAIMSSVGGNTAADVAFDPVAGNPATEVQTAIANNTSDIADLQDDIVGDLAVTSVTASGNISGATVAGSMIATQGEAEAGTANDVVMTPLSTAYAIDSRVTRTAVVDLTADGASGYTFTGVPAGTNRVELFMYDITLTTNQIIDVQVGDSGGIETSGHTGMTSILTSAAQTVAGLSGFRPQQSTAATGIAHYKVVMDRAPGTHRWVFSSHGMDDDGVNSTAFSAKTLSDELTQIEISTSGTFTSGSAFAIYS